MSCNFLVFVICFMAYSLRCADDSLYCGWTTDLERRMEAHNGHVPGGAKYTRGRRPVTLVYSESFHNKQDAQRREYAIKQMTKIVCLLSNQSVGPKVMKN